MPFVLFRRPLNPMVPPPWRPPGCILMSLMAAGVPIKKMVAGISCGLVTGDTDDDFVLLTDIQGLEDFFGDMDFKVTGTTAGITAIQMDIKIHGLTRPIVEGAIERCREARTVYYGKLHEEGNCGSPDRR